MSFPRELFPFTAMILVFHCKADYPPSRLSYDWLDPFTVKVSWETPVGLPNGTEVQYKYRLVKNGPDEAGHTYVTLTKWRNFTQNILTEDMNVDRWTFNVWTVIGPFGTTDNGSARVPITIASPKDRAQLVKDFKCLISTKTANCSWIPKEPSLNLTLSYRTCGCHEARLKGLKTCEQPYISGERNGCTLQIDATSGDICIHVDSGKRMSTFKAALAVHSPKMEITEKGDHLILSWTPPLVGSGCSWKYTVCYKRCGEKQDCRDVVNEKPTMSVAYNRNCLYEFHSRGWTDNYCKNVTSDYSNVTYGANEPPDGTQTVVVIVIPIILSMCVLLSCYCFRRHRAIICPIIPDPSAIFKEMMMNGNKEVKATAGSLYTPVPEPIEPCKITLVAEGGVPQQHY